MLRIRNNERDAFNQDSEFLPANCRDKLAASGLTIIREFQEPYLEMIRLLQAAAEVEHALLVQYLYAAFSIKPIYPKLIGGAFSDSFSFMGVAIQEMHHLDGVNRFLVALSSGPNLTSQDFPFSLDVYPFDLNLERLIDNSLAKYVFTEAPLGALDPQQAETEEDRQFLDRLYHSLGSVRPNHLGSVYRTILEVAHELTAAPPFSLPDLTPYLENMQGILEEGEKEHFRFFKEVFLGKRGGLEAVENVWRLNPQDPAYPSYLLPMNPSAIEGHPREIEDQNLRQLAWLSDLHYWIILMLLDFSYRIEDPDKGTDLLLLAQEHMTGPLSILGSHLASKGAGIPFDRLDMNYSVGINTAATFRFIERLLTETQRWTDQLAPQLPGTYTFSTVKTTLKALKKIGGF